jgi:predicted DNA-binding transcriptional regulator YafY
VSPARREELVSTALAVRADEPDADGWLRLEVTFQDLRHAEWALWQLASDAEALAPQSLRTALRNRAAAMATLYRASTRTQARAVSTNRDSGRRVDRHADRHGRLT